MCSHLLAEDHNATLQAVDLAALVSSLALAGAMHVFELAQFRFEVKRPVSLIVRPAFDCAELLGEQPRVPSGPADELIERSPLGLELIVVLPGRAGESANIVLIAKATDTRDPVTSWTPEK
jgi:hypothetical protein